MLEMQRQTQQRMAEMRKRFPLPEPRLPQGFTPPARPDMGQMATNQFVGQVCKLIEILVAAGHPADAEQIHTQALSVVADPRLQSALRDAEKKVQNTSDANPPTNSATLLLAAQPPVVVETQPQSGAQDVPPGETEIRVRFSKPMAEGSWSWSTAWEDSTPESLADPHYLDDQRTCVMKVRLAPGKTYAWWLNSEKFKHFRDRSGQPAVPYLLIFKTSNPGNANPPPAGPRTNGPSVIYVSPANGATNVDLLQALRIRFDQPMDPQAMEIRWWSGGFFADGQYRYDPERNEFIIPVRLLAGQTNDLSLGNFADFKSALGTPAGKYHWHFTTRPQPPVAGAVKPRLIKLTPAPNSTLPVLTLLEATFDQPMQPPDQGFPFLEKNWAASASAVIPYFDYDPQAHRFTIPLVLPANNPVKLTLDGFVSASGLPGDPIVLRYDVGTNNYSRPQRKQIATAAQDPRLEKLLSAMQQARQRLTSGTETVQNIFLCGEPSFTQISAHHATFKWQGTNQVYADISEIMGGHLKSFVLGSDGLTCWLSSEDQYDDRQVESTAGKEYRRGHQYRRSFCPSDAPGRIRDRRSRPGLCRPGVIGGTSLSQAPMLDGPTAAGEARPSHGRAIGMVDRCGHRPARATQPIRDLWL